MEKNRQRSISSLKHDYRRKPFVLLGWGLASDFDVYSASRSKWFFRILLLLFTVALFILLMLVWRW